MTTPDMNERINGKYTRRALWNAFDLLRELAARRKLEEAKHAECEPVTGDVCSCDSVAVPECGRPQVVEVA